MRRGRFTYINGSIRDLFILDRWRAPFQPLENATFIHPKKITKNCQVQAILRDSFHSWLYFGLIFAVCADALN